MPTAIGFSSLFASNALATTTLRAQTDLVGFVASRREIEELIQTTPTLNRAMLEFLSAEVRQWRPHPVDAKAAQEKSPQKKVVVFDCKSYDESHLTPLFDAYHAMDLEVVFVESKLTPETVSLARHAYIAMVFVNDNVNAFVVDKLSRYGCQMIALRCAGFNNVDIEACDAHGISVVRVPAYSPHAVAEHALALMMALNRKICIASAHTKAGDFSLSNFMTGFGLCLVANPDMYGKTVGIVSTGKIGKLLINILLGMGCKIACYDVKPDDELRQREGVRYLDSLDELFPLCDVISIHSPLLPSTKHMICRESISKMKKGVMLINTSRGGLVDTEALIEGLKSGQVGYAGLDVYENESDYFFEDMSDKVIKDDLLSRLLSFNNVIVTSHQALDKIASTTLSNIEEFCKHGKRAKELTNSLNKK
ncbi:hypothetical protein HDU91_002546 [Kappamyces sp. JEL0680]|nr:hypothetical protein HDU91_002546 [Kappamyces sp. JEL0680]